MRGAGCTRGFTVPSKIQLEHIMLQCLVAILNLVYSSLNNFQAIPISDHLHICLQMTSLLTCHFFMIAAHLAFYKLKPDLEHLFTNAQLC